MMKKIFALLLALVMALSLMACGQKEDNIGGASATPTAKLLQLIDTKLEREHHEQ